MIWFLVLVLWPLAELYVIVKLSEWIGFIWVLLAILISWPIGSRVIRAEGRAALRRLREALAAGRTPTKEVLDGALVLFGGLLLLVPGFISDAFGLLLLLPPTRALARRAAARHSASRRLGRTADFISWGVRGGRGAGSGSGGRGAGSGSGGRGAGSGPGGAASRGRGPDAGSRSYDADATAVDVDEPQLKP